EGGYIRERSPTGEAIRILRLKPDEPRDAVQRLRRWASDWLQVLRNQLERLTRSSSGPEPAPEQPATGFTSSLPPSRARRERTGEPPSLSELPVLRLAEIEESEPEGDLYEGDDAAAGHPVWLWAKRIAWVTVFAGIAGVAVMTFERWSPKVAQLGWLVVT